MLLATFFLMLAGLVSLALSMPRRHQALFGAFPSSRRGLGVRCAGTTLLAAALGAAVGAEGRAIGIVLWFAAATLAAQGVALFFAYQHHWRRRS